MKIYLVGGAVRDIMLGLEPKDRDYVVVGATKDDINTLLATGHHWVGKDFPVLIGPDGCEYALARTERKIGVGYYGFETYSGSDVTLEQDLSRRDLTINSMALSDTGELIDPYNGKYDLEHKRLCHTTAAFAEDPVRVLRLARFAARLGDDWYIALKTKFLCNDMVAAGRLKDLVPERVWQEMYKALTEKHTDRFFYVLRDTGLFPELDILSSIPQPKAHHPEIWTFTHVMLAIQQAEKLGSSPPVKFAVLLHDLGKVIYNTTEHLHGHEGFGVLLVEAFCTKWKVPNTFKDLALHVTEYHGIVHSVLGSKSTGMVNPNKIVDLFNATGALRNPDHFKDILLACEADARGRTGFEDREYPQRQYLIECLEAVLALDTKPISEKLLAKGKSGIHIGEQIRCARINAVKGVKNKWKAALRSI